LSRVPAERADRVEAAATEAGLDAVIVGDLVNPGDSGRDAMADMIWLTGYQGSSGIGVVGPGARFFLTDFRYLEVASKVVPEGFEVVDGTSDIMKALGGLIEGRGKVGIDESKTSVEVHHKLTEAIKGGAELVAAEGLLEGLRRVKDAREIEAIARSAAVVDEVYAWIEDRGLAGRTEREVALGAEQRMRELGAEGPPFSSIVGSGPNGSLAHGDPSERRIGRGEYVVIDMGAIVDGYCSDCTRTLVDGDPDPAQRGVYEIVLAAQQAGLDAVRAGASGREVDAKARAVIEEAGHGERFGHGLGHGVGIEVHEAPRLSKRSEDELLAGDVVTIEPCIYFPGEYGIRIEDLVVVTEDGHRNLSSRPK
jgi:Xaa-Pro aminopeptidase